MAKKKKALIRQFEEIVEEEAEMVMGLHGAEFMLESLEKRLKQLGERYQVGIIHEEIPIEEDEEEG